MLRGEHRIKLFQDWDQGSHFTEQFKEQIKSQVSWEYPCLEIFPGSGGFLPYMLGAEPLYIADWDKDLLDHVSQQFNSYYSNRRLMKYQFEDSDLSKLPQNSFGFIYSLNWSKLDTEQGLLELARGVYDCLMPGGKYLFAFNSIDTEYGVDMVAMGHRGGADSKSLIAGLEAIGYEIEQSSLASSGWKSSWMIVKRPGEIEYIKAGSILAKIIDKPSDL